MPWTIKEDGSLMEWKSILHNRPLNSISELILNEKNLLAGKWYP